MVLPGLSLRSLLRKASAHGKQTRPMKKQQAVNRTAFITPTPVCRLGKMYRLLCIDPPGSPTSSQYRMLSPTLPTIPQPPAGRSTGRIC